MLLQVVAIRDAKTEVFSHPMFFVTKGQAVRSFYDEAVREGSDIKKHVEDFAMFYLGTYDDQTAAFNCILQPEQIALALDAKV